MNAVLNAETVEVRLNEEVQENLDKLDIDPYKWRILLALQQNLNLYKGTVSLKEKRRRRAHNKAQRRARRNNR